MKTTWILVANASEARLFEAQKSYQKMQLIESFYHPQSREKTVNLVTDASGRYRNFSAPISAYDEPSNPKQVEAHRFAQVLAHKLNEGRTQNLYNHLVLVAPPYFHGLLNKCCNTKVKNKVVNALDKDYTKLKARELLKHLDGKLNLYKAA